MKESPIDRDLGHYLKYITVILAVFLFLIPGISILADMLFIPAYTDKFVQTSTAMMVTPEYMKKAFNTSTILPPTIFLLIGGPMTLALMKLDHKNYLKRDLKKKLRFLLIGFACVGFIVLVGLAVIWGDVVEAYGIYSCPCVQERTQGFPDGVVKDFSLLDNGEMVVYLINPYDNKIAIADASVILDGGVNCSLRAEPPARVESEDHALLLLSCPISGKYTAGKCIKGGADIKYTLKGAQKHSAGRISVFVEGKV